MSVKELVAIACNWEIWIRALHVGSVIHYLKIVVKANEIFTSLYGICLERPDRIPSYIVSGVSPYRYIRGWQAGERMQVLCKKTELAMY